MQVLFKTLIKQASWALLFLFAFPCTIISQSHTSTAISCGSASISFEQQCYDTTFPVSFIHVHENETTALEAAHWLLDSVKKACLTTWKSQQQRFINFTFENKAFRFDPNRIYTAVGLKATLGINLTKQKAVFDHVQTIANLFLQQYIIGKKAIIAVHNNTDAGGLSVKSYSSKGIYTKDAETVYINPKKDTDDFFYTTESTFFNYVKNKGYNVVLQNNKKVTDDGSLSVFCGSHNISYINIETQFEHLQEQKEMLQATWSYIAIALEQQAANP
jgi:hypothetical protein